MKYVYYNHQSFLSNNIKHIQNKKEMMLSNNNEIVGTAHHWEGDQEKSGKNTFCIFIFSLLR